MVKYSDRYLLAALEDDIKQCGPLVLWDGVGKFPGDTLRGLSIGTRTLREALAVLAEAFERRES